MAVPQVADLRGHLLTLGLGLRGRGDGAPGAGERDADAAVGGMDALEVAVGPE
jgi:hypothetical protein